MSTEIKQKSDHSHGPWNKSRLIGALCDRKRSGRLCHEKLSLAAQIFVGRFGSCRGGGSPRRKGLLAKDAERAAGYEMALDVESVVDGGVNGQEALG